MTRALPACLLVASVVALAAPRGQSQDRLFTHDGSTDDAGLGYAVSGLPDIDGDGVRDYIVGSLGCTSANGNLARLFSGTTGALIREHSGDPAGCYGMAVADLGDLDGDGIGDYGISAVREDSQLALQAGRVYLHSGGDGRLIRVHEGDAAGARFGISISSAGDLDADGVPDVMIGSPWDATLSWTRGSVDVYSGATGALLRHFDGDQEQDQFGYSTAGVGDLDGDGVGDLLIGAPIRWYDASGDEGPGYVRLFSGASGAQLGNWVGSTDGDHYGTSVSGISDLDGDGVGELVIGAPRRRVPDPDGPGTLELGLLEVRSGASGAVLFSSHGEPDSKYGTSVAPLGDFDGDGFDDVLVGACYCQNNIFLSGGAGWLEVRSGATGELLATLADGKPFQSFAFALAPLGDISDDGVPDFVVGNTFDDTHGYKTGSAWVYSGADLSLLTLTHELSVSQGGSQALGLLAGPEHAGASYLLLGSLSGSSPGLGLAGGSVHLPLNPDVWFELTFAYPNNGVHVASLGSLDASGNALAAVSLPPGLIPPSAAGLVLHHAYVVFEPGVVHFASNALPLTLLP